MLWEVNYVEGFEDFIIRCKLNDESVYKMKARLEYVSQSPINLTEHVQGLSIPNLRRVRFGDYRIFILVDMIGQTITCLAIISRKHCYDKKELNKIITIVSELLNKKHS